MLNIDVYDAHLSMSLCCIFHREIQDEELHKFYGRISKLLNANRDHGNETIDSLQRLNLIVSATKYAKT